MSTVTSFLEPESREGSSHDGWWELTVVFPAIAMPGAWQVHALFLSDEAGNAQTIDGSELRKRGFDIDVQVTNRNLTLGDATREADSIFDFVVQEYSPPDEAEAEAEEEYYY